MPESHGRVAACPGPELPLSMGLSVMMKRLLESLSAWVMLGAFIVPGVLWAESSVEEEPSDMALPLVDIQDMSAEIEPPAPDPEAVFAEQVDRLATGNLRERREMAEALVEGGHPRAGMILNALLEGRLLTTWSTPETPALIILQRGEDAPGRVEQAVTGEVLADGVPSGARAVPINNPMRNLLRDLAAMADMNHALPQRRILASERLMRGSLGPEQMALIESRLLVEEHPRVIDALEITQAVGLLRHEDAQVRLESLERLRGSLLAVVRSTVGAVAEQDPDPIVRQHAVETLEAIQTRIAFYRFTENLFFGLSLGSVLLLAALGLAITFGVMGVINMAHGELIMIGAYTTWFLQTLMPGNLTTALLLAIPAAFLISGLVGVAMERGIIQFLYGRPLETLLATFGLSLILQQAVRSLFSPLNQAVASPEWISGSLAVNPVLSLTWNRIYILIFALLVFLALLLILKRTTLGLKVRAVSQNRAMARSLGVRASWVDAMTFGLGAGIAGVAGVALAQLTNVGPNMGQSYIVDSFMVVVFGGVGNIWGTFVGALGLGVMTKFMEPFAGAVLAKIFVLIFIILFIQYRPRGLFPQKGRSAEA
ncbi:urea ABC transporter permease subunit UrtB [Ectothiorhodospira shaposhnikovii]|uniref:urea ABC transporter permease subunit UrtB n=1 Tax=Ectothiorhodospira shaposhnikovii TaxID=1054 RepID=UPI001F5B7DF0|nr:urea ABC transporter permease subunit UrtB [Ectothiorhodospira shaposhnikovii]